MKQTKIEQINALQNELTFALARKYEQLIDNQLTAKQVLLLELIRSGITSSKQLAEHVNVSTSAISQLLNKLEELGYITRTINRENRRKVNIELAAKGVTYFQKVDQFDKEMNEEIFGQLPDEDIDALHRIIEKLLHIVKGE